MSAPNSKPEAVGAVVGGASQRRFDWALSACAALFTALLAAFQSGRIHPDEVYQFLEPANRLAFHFGFLSWEWDAGVRNWALPAFLAAALKVAHALGATGPMGHRLGIAGALALMGYPGYLGLIRYGERRSSGNLTGRIALGLAVAWALSLYFLGRSLGEPMGVMLGVAAIAALDDDARPFRGGLIAGLWLGLAVVVRYGFASLVVAVMVQQLVERRWKALAGAAVTGGAVALALGVLDWATWGKPWHSIFGYMQFNLGGAAARMFGTKPWWFYLDLMKTWTPWPLLLGLPWWSWKRDRMLLPAAAYLYALSSTPYKVDRFIFPVLFLITCSFAPAAAEGLVSLWKRAMPMRAVAVAALAGYLALSGWVYATQLPDLESDLFKATMKVAADPALDQLIIVNESRWGCGGNFYVARDIPIYYTGPGYPGYVQAMRNPAVNRAVIFRSPKDQADLERFGFHQIGAVGETTILARP